MGTEDESDHGGLLASGISEAAVSKRQFFLAGWKMAAERSADPCSIRAGGEAFRVPGAGEG